MPGERVIAVERNGHVACVWLDRPAARNAMGLAFFAQLPEVFTDLGADPVVRAIVLAARGPHFSVGLDLKELGATLVGAGFPAPDVVSPGASASPGTIPEVPSTATSPTTS